MDIKSQFDIKVGDSVKYYDYASHSDRAGKACEAPESIQNISSNYVWCNFDDENVPEAIDIIRTTLTKLDFLDDLTKKEEKSDETDIQSTCSHPEDQVVISHVGMGTSAIKYKYCRACKADLGDVK